MKKLIFAALLGVSFNNNSLADWTRLGVGENLSDLYIDVDTVRRTGDKAKVWTMEDLKTSNGMYLSNKIQWELNCKEVESRRPAFVTYAGNKASGGTLLSHYDANEIWQPLAPGSLGEAILKAGCDETIGAHKWNLVLEQPKPTPDRTSLRIYFDSASTQRKGDIVSVWMLFDIKSVDHDPKNGNFSFKISGEYDCIRVRKRNISTETYSANMGIGIKVQGPGDAV